MGNLKKIMDLNMNFNILHSSALIGKGSLTEKNRSILKVRTR